MGARRTASAIAALAILALLDPLGAQERARLAQLPAAAVPAPAKPQPVKRTERPVPFAVGEKLAYDVSWSSYVTAGSATMTVQEKKPSYGSVAYYIYAEGQPVSLLAQLYDLYYKADTHLDVYSLLPQRASVFSREGRRQRMKTTMFDRRTNTAVYEVQTRRVSQTASPSHPERKELRVAAASQDPLGAIYVLRALTLKAGDRFAVPICDAGESYRVDVSVASPEPVKSGIGELRAWRITPVLPKDQSSDARRLTLWLSDDARRLPVKMQAELAVGTFDLTLRSVAR